MSFLDALLVMDIGNVWPLDNCAHISIVRYINIVKMSLNQLVYLAVNDKPILICIVRKSNNKIKQTRNSRVMYIK